MRSNHLIRIAFIVALLLLAFSTPSLMKKVSPQSQPPTAAAPPGYALIEYFKIEPGKIVHLLALRLALPQSPDR